MDLEKDNLALNVCKSNCLIPLPDSDLDLDLDLDSKPYGYTLLCRACFDCTDSYLIQIQIPFPNGYCTHFWDGSPSQGQNSVPITYISIRGSESKSKPMEKSCIVQEFVSKNPSPAMEISHYIGESSLTLFFKKSSSFFCLKQMQNIDLLFQVSNNYRDGHEHPSRTSHSV